MSLTVLPFHHGLRVSVKNDEAPPIKIPTSSVILLVGTAPMGPCNVPTLIIGSLAEAVSLFGEWQPWHKAAGITIPEALRGMYDQGAQTVVVINVMDTSVYSSDFFEDTVDADKPFDRRGILRTTRQTHLASSLAISAQVKYEVQLPASGPLTVLLPKGYTTVTAVKKVGSTSVTSGYVSGTGVLTVTAGAAFNDKLILTINATWSSSTDYLYNPVEGTISVRAGGRLLPGMIVDEVEYSAPKLGLTGAAIHDLVIGEINNDSTRTGLELAETIESSLHIVPKLVICPRLTDRVPAAINLASPVVTKMDAVCKLLGARAITSCENVLAPDAVANTATHYADPDSRIGVVCWPDVIVTGPDGELTSQPADARIAGLQSVVDRSEGFHECFSNRKLQGVLGVSKAVTHSWLNDQTQSNYLNELGVVAIVAEQGYYKAHGVWQPNLEMLSVLRTADMINLGIVNANHWVLDKAFTLERARQIMQRVKTLFRLLEADQVLIPNPSPDSNPDIWFNPALNSPDRMAQGKFVFSYRFNPPPLMTDVTFDAHITRTYLEGFAKQIKL